MSFTLSSLSPFSPLSLFSFHHGASTKLRSSKIAIVGHPAENLEDFVGKKTHTIQKKILVLEKNYYIQGWRTVNRDVSDNFGILNMDPIRLLK